MACRKALVEAVSARAFLWVGWYAHPKKLVSGHQNSYLTNTVTFLPGS